MFRGTVPLRRFERKSVCDLDFRIWLNRDPIQEEGGLNLYGFVGNNPNSYIDPDGRFIDTLWDVANLIYDAWYGNWDDFSADLIAAAIPGVPAGTTKIAKPGLTACKKALKEVHEKVGGRLPKGPPSRIGSPTRGTGKRGYRMDPPHEHKPFWHFHWWKGKRLTGNAGEVRID